MSRGSVLTVVVLLFLGVFVEAQNTSFDFPDFITANGNISVDGDSSFNFNDASYEMNNGGANSNRNSCGRITYRNPVQMLDSNNGTVASFQTAFTASFSSSEANCGDGMAFTFLEAPEISTDDYANKSGGGFCLLGFNYPDPSRKVFAVEFDSFMNLNINETSNAHIGVDISTTSLATADLCAIDTMSRFCNSTSSFCGEKGKFAAWIDYDSGAQKLEVRIRQVASGNSTALKPARAAITVNNLDLNQVFKQNMYVGFSAATGHYQETHKIHSWTFATTGIVTVPSPPMESIPPTAPSPPAAPSSNKTSTPTIVGGICGAVGGCAILGLLLCRFCKRRRMKADQEQMQYSNLGELGLTETSWEFTYRELSRITKNFSDTELLASGGFGDVFKGTLASGALVAVKRIKRRKEQGVKSFVVEATSMRQIRHRHLLQLRGWCVSKEGMLLVFDFMSNSSLDKWIHSKSDDRPTLSWQVRRNILAGVASGLAYLHGEWVQCVLHRDIKSSNVMLDANFNAYLGDFGLARLVDHHEVDKTTLLAGTLGYMAPEMHHTGRATKETDVYAFGILMLEVVCGRRPLDSGVADPGDYVLVDCVWRAHAAGALLSVADHTLVMDEGNEVGQTSELFTMIRWMLQLGLLCCHPNPGERPSMRDVDQWLFSQARDGVGTDLPRLPATRPYFEHYLSATQEFSGSGTITASSSSQTSSLMGASSSSQTQPSSSHPSHLADHVSLEIEDFAVKTSTSVLLKEFGDHR